MIQEIIECAEALHQRNIDRPMTNQELESYTRADFGGRGMIGWIFAILFLLGMLPFFLMCPIPNEPRDFSAEWIRILRIAVIEPAQEFLLYG